MYKRDYTIIIKADANDEVYWQMLRKGEPAACNEEEEKLAKEMLGEVFHKLEVNAFWKQSKREESDEDITTDTTGKKYSHCGAKMVADTSKVCTSNPPQYEYRCPKCGNVEYGLCSDYYTDNKE